MNKKNVHQIHWYCGILLQAKLDARLILLDSKSFSNFWSYFSAALVCALNYLPNGECSNLFNAAAFSKESFSGKISSPATSLYLLIFPDDNAEIVAICIYIVLSFIMLDFVIDSFDFLANTHFVISSS